RAPAQRPGGQAATPASAAPSVAVSSRTTLVPRAGSKSTRITRSRPSRTCSMCVIKMTCGKRSASRRSSPTTCRRRASSSDPEIGERAVQRVVEALARLQLGDVALALGALTLAPLRFPYVVLHSGQRPARFDYGELGLAQRAHRAVVAILRLPISLVREPLG